MNEPKQGMHQNTFPLGKTRLLFGESMSLKGYFIIYCVDIDKKII